MKYKLYSFLQRRGILTQNAIKLAEIQPDNQDIGDNKVPKHLPFLDEGEDAVFFESSKFDKIVETVDSIFNEPDGTVNKTAALVDAIVREDPATGQTSLNIPVPDKNTVVNNLSAFSAFINR